MAFLDEIKIVVKAGDGGNGSSSFRRERYVTKGGPDGGDGGRGGSIYLMTDHNEHSLVRFLRDRRVTATNGGYGRPSKSAGKSGKDLVLNVPVGTQVAVFKEGKKGKTEEYIVADLDKPGEKFLLAKGGEGGLGNTHFARAGFQTPRFADLGEPGEEKEVLLRLKMVAEVGVMGLPNAGKSTLLSVISNAKPKIADYAFTTIVPNLGIVSLSDRRFLVADIPGLIADAHKGKGLGIDFLKHIERTKVLIHILDATSESIKKDFSTVNSELKKHAKELIQKPQVIAINKIDLVDDKRLKTLKRYKFGSYPVHYISAVTHQGVDQLVYDTANILSKAPKAKEKIHVYTLDDIPMNRFEVYKKSGKFSVKGDKVERLIVKTDFNNFQALGRMYKILKRMGVLSELKKIGIQEGDMIKIGKQEIEYKQV